MAHCDMFSHSQPHHVCVLESRPKEPVSPGTVKDDAWSRCACLDATGKSLVSKLNQTQQVAPLGADSLAGCVLYFYPRSFRLGLSPLLSPSLPPGLTLAKDPTG